MIKIEKNGRTKLIPEGALKVLGDQLDGWEIASKEVAPFKEPKKPEVPKAPEAPKDETPFDEISKGEKHPTREEMIAYLKEKGVACNPRINDLKLRERYELEINT